MHLSCLAMVKRATFAGKDPIFQPEEYSARDKREPRQFPEGVFGQKYPQNITTKEGYPSVDSLQVKPEAQHKDADKVGLDGLPHVGAVVWPSESYYSTVDRMTCKSSVVVVHGECVSHLCLDVVLHEMV